MLMISSYIFFYQHEHFILKKYVPYFVPISRLSIRKHVTVTVVERFILANI